MNKLGLRITNNGREAYVANPNHDWELHTVDFNACLLTLDNLDEGEGMLILSHDSSGCYLGFVHLLKQGFNGLCIAASIFVPQNLSVDGNTMRQLINEVRSQLGGTMLDTAALDRVFAAEYPEKDYIPVFQPQHSKTIAFRKEDWTDEVLQHLLDSRCLFQPAYAQHRATLLIDAHSGIVSNGIDITDVPVVIPEPEPEPEPESVVVEEPEIEVVEEPEAGVSEESEPELTILEEKEEASETPIQHEQENGQETDAGVEVVLFPPDEGHGVSYSRELNGGNDSVPSNDGVDVVYEPSDDDGVEVVSVYPIPPNATVPPPPPSPDVMACYGIADYPKNDNIPDSANKDSVYNGPTHGENGNDIEASKRKFVTFLIFLLLGILLAFIASVSFSSKDKSSEERSAEASTSVSVSEAYPLAEASVPEEVDLNLEIYNTYVGQLESKAVEVGADEDGYCEYFLYDITGDGIPELWVKSGTCEADFMLYVYRYDVNGLSLMHSTGAGHSSFYCGDGYVIQMVAHMGAAEWYRLTLNGSGLDEELVYEETDEYGGYTYPDEPDADMYDYDETWPIAAALGV